MIMPYDLRQKQLASSSAGIPCSIRDLKGTTNCMESVRLWDHSLQEMGSQVHQVRG